MNFFTFCDVCYNIIKPDQVRYFKKDYVYNMYSPIYKLGTGKYDIVSAAIYPDYEEAGYSYACIVTDKNKQYHQCSINLAAGLIHQIIRHKHIATMRRSK